MLIDETPDFNVSDEEVEQILAGAEKEGPTGLVEETEETPVEVAAETKVEQKLAPKVEPPKEQEFEFVHNGRQVKAPLSQIIKWAQQGYDYPQKMERFNKERQQIEQLKSTYAPIDEWVKANPDKWDRLQAAIHAEKQEIPADHPLVQKLKQYDDFINEIKSEKQAVQVKQEDEALDREIKSIQEKYKDLDWGSLDDHGRNREQKVLAHATEHGFSSFKAAFLDLYHEELLLAAETRAKEQLAATKEKQVKTGLLPSNTSKAAPKLSAPQVKGKHYPTTQEILAELGIQ
jgi:hypothetical protein